jgi:hypothetical protein
MWNSIGRDDSALIGSALIIVGAGYPLGVLKEENAPPSTKDLLQKAVCKCPKDYPILNEIFSNQCNLNLSLSQLWQNIFNYAILVSHAYLKIVEEYKKIDPIQSNKPSMSQFIKTKSNAGWSHVHILNTGIGLEIAKVISDFYSPTNKDKF